MDIKTYSDAQQYLESLIPNTQNKRSTNMRLERIENLLRLIDYPHRSFKSVHVGGTSGKGSTAYLISHILSTAGYKTGLHISPHLQTINERIQINNQPISDQEFTELVHWIKPYVDNVGENNPFGAPSYFEVLTALSFEHFKREKVAIAIIEVGLGGILDATNVINPLVAVITNVDLDHTELLGNTVEKIARDKAGIIKDTIEVVTGAQQQTVTDIIIGKCREENAPLTIIGQNVTYTVKKIDIKGSVFDVTIMNKTYHDLHLSLLGRHQVANAVCAITACELLKKSGFIPTEQHIRNALSKASFDGRIEIFKRNPLLIIDGAHNPAKMSALVQSIQELFHQKVIAVVGFKKKKDVKSMLKILMPITKKFVATKFLTTTDMGSNLSVEPSDIVEYIKKMNVRVSCKKENLSSNALLHTLKNASPDDIILITGSLYLVGEIRSALLPKLKSFSQFP